MRKLGLIGGTGPESTIEYYRGIVYGVEEASGVLPQLVIESLSVFDVLRFSEAKDYDGLTRYLLRGIRNLEGAGADTAALTGITPHVVFDRLSAISPLPLVSMVETSCICASGKGYHRVGLLGTGPTMDGSFFKEAFARHGIETVTPSLEEKRYIASRIETELEYGRIVPETREKFCGIAGRMRDEDGIDAVVLGCTELPMIFKGVSLPVPALDVMREHIDFLVRFIMEG